MGIVRTRIGAGKGARVHGKSHARLEYSRDRTTLTGVRTTGSALRQRLREAAPSAIALAVHAALALSLVVTGRGPGGAGTARQLSVDATQEVDLVHAAPSTDTIATHGEAAKPAREVASAKSIASGSTRPADEMKALAPGTAAHDVEAATAGDADWFRSTTGDLDIGLGTAGAMKVASLQPGEGQGGRAPAAPRPVSTTGGLFEALDQGDVERGMGHGGPVRSAVDAAAHRPDAPTFGKAVFAVALAADGSVHVSLAGSSGDPKGWEALRPAIREAVEKAPKRIRIAGKGVLVTVAVEAKEQFASGATPTPDKKQGLGAQGSLGAVHETKEHVEFELPSGALTFKTRNCGAGVSLSAGGIGLSGNCESGVAMRVVSTKIVAEQRL